MSPDDVVTVAEIADLKLNQQTVRNRIDQGYLPAIRVGRRVASAGAMMKPAGPAFRRAHQVVSE